MDCCFAAPEYTISDRNKYSHVQLIFSFILQSNTGTDGRGQAKHKRALLLRTSLLGLTNSALVPVETPLLLCLPLYYSIRSARYCHHHRSAHRDSSGVSALPRPPRRHRTLNPPPPTTPTHTHTHTHTHTLAHTTSARPLTNFLRHTATAQGYCSSPVTSATSPGSPFLSVHTQLPVRRCTRPPGSLTPPRRHWRHTESRWALKWEVCTRSLST